MSEVKGQDKASKKQLNEVKIGILPEKKIRIMIVKKIQDLGKRIEKMQGVFIKTQKNQRTNKQMKNTLEGMSSRITEAEEWICDLEDRMVEITAAKQNIEKGMKEKRLQTV